MAVQGQRNQARPRAYWRRVLRETRIESDVLKPNMVMHTCISALNRLRQEDHEVPKDELWGTSQKINTKQINKGRDWVREFGWYKCLLYKQECLS